jgi:tripartite-type tricarboxylate transporter receptor subunit TctC
MARIKWSGIFVIAMLVLFSMTSEAAQKPGNYPNKPIRLIVPFAAGGGTDTSARTLSSYAEKFIGQQLIVENKPGGGSAIGTAYAAAAKPDGYTLYLAVSGPVSMTPQMVKVPFTQDSFIPILQVGDDPTILVSRGKAPWKNLKELVAYAKANPGKVNHGVATGAYVSLAGLLAISKMGIEVTNVPFTGAGPITAALIGGHVDLAAVYPVTAAPLIESGDLVGLAVSNEKRIPELPKVPTFIELGYDIDMRAWRGVLAPRGTPPEIVQYLHDSFKRLIESNEYRGLADKLHENVVYRDGKALKALWNKEYQIVGMILESIGMKLK